MIHGRRSGIHATGNGVSSSSSSSSSRSGASTLLPLNRGHHPSQMMPQTAHRSWPLLHPLASAWPASPPSPVIMHPPIIHPHSRQIKYHTHHHDYYHHHHHHHHAFYSAHHSERKKMLLNKVTSATNKYVAQGHHHDNNDD